MRGFGIPAMKFLIRSIADAPDIKESMFEWKHHGFAEKNNWKWRPKIHEKVGKNICVDLEFQP